MASKTLTYADWLLEANVELTRQAYATVPSSGAETCGCRYCQNYVAYRDQVFTNPVRQLFSSLGIDYRKEVEAVQYDRLPDGRHLVGGWFHFKGQVLAEPSYRKPAPTDPDYLADLPQYFSLSFAERSDLTFFPDKTGLVQVDFETIIPWVISPLLESSG